MESNGESVKPDEPKPVVTLGIANYRGGSKLPALLESICRLEGPRNFEVVIVDDGSPLEEQAQATKEAYEILRDIDHTFVSSFVNRGCVATYNTIFENARAPVVALLDNDVILPSQWLRTAYLLYTIIANVGVLSWRSIKILGQRAVDNAGSGGPLLEPSTDLAGYCFMLSVIGWNKVGGFDEKFRNYQADSDICARLWQAGHRSYRVHYPVVGHEEHATLGMYQEETQANIPADMAYFKEKWGKNSYEVNQTFLKEASLLAI